MGKRSDEGVQKTLEKLKYTYIIMSAQLLFVFVSLLVTISASSSSSSSPPPSLAR